MKKKPDERRGGYRGVRDFSTGLTPRQEVDTRRAQLLAIEIARQRGLLIEKTTVEAGIRECAEVIQSDLFGALPSRCATVLGGKKKNAEQVRLVVRQIVDEIVGNWISAEIVPQEAKPKEP